MGVPPSYLDEAGDAWQIEGIDIRAHEISDIMKVMRVARNLSYEGIRVF